MKNRPIILVNFYDTTHDPGWQDEGMDFGGCSSCVAVGWRIHSNNKRIVLAMMRSDGGRCSERMIIPRGVIIRQAYLKEQGID